uniref:hypothetical protein n=1 Tax=Bacteroidota TaxID=976 RepID=UPI0040477434
MAINKAAASLLFELKTNQEIGGTICQLGKQTILISTDKVREVAKDFGFESKETDEKFPWTGNAIDDYLFRTLGYNTVESIDTDGFEGATYILDLNLDVPKEFHNRFDAIYDGGTLEHIFNLPQALKNIFCMLKPGGLIMHLSPSHNHVDHGFYMFSPTFFYDYYQANNYKIIRSNFLEYTHNPFDSSWKIYNYKSLCIEDLAFGGWGTSMLGIWFVVQKTDSSSFDIVPQQARYVMVWEKHKSKSSFNMVDKVPMLKSLIRNIKTYCKSISFIYKFLYLARKFYFGFRFLFKSRHKPKVIARY